MEGYGAKTYGDWIAEDYDHLHVGRYDTDACVELLAGLAGEGPVLELGVGTGRVALPLAARGLRVHGIDVSEAMVERLRAKPGGETVRVTFGDFAEVPVAGTFRLVFVAFNTLFALPSQGDQVPAPARALGRLAPRAVQRRQPHARVGVRADVGDGDTRAPGRVAEMAHRAQPPL